MSLLVEWQGGGVFVSNGNVDFNSCNIYGNTASAVSLPPLEAPWTQWTDPHGKPYGVCFEWLLVQDVSARFLDLLPIASMG
jgi:hypothetical protein